jgi:hypothetical protein
MKKIAVMLKMGFSTDSFIDECRQFTNIKVYDVNKAGVVFIETDMDCVDVMEKFYMAWGASAIPDSVEKNK